MFIEIDLQSDVPLYTQLADQLIEGIATGALKPGEPLPSVRSLAADLDINMHTINKAYQILKQEGFLIVHRKQGAIVQNGRMPGLDDAFLAKMSGRLRPLAAEAIVRGMDEESFVRHCREAFGLKPPTELKPSSEGGEQL